MKDIQGYELSELGVRKVSKLNVLNFLKRHPNTNPLDHRNEFGGYMPSKASIERILDSLHSDGLIAWNEGNVYVCTSTKKTA